MNHYWRRFIVVGLAGALGGFAGLIGGGALGYLEGLAQNKPPVLALIGVPTALFGCLLGGYLAGRWLEARELDASQTARQSLDEEWDAPLFRRQSVRASGMRSGEFNSHE